MNARRSSSASSAVVSFSRSEPQRLVAQARQLLEIGHVGADVLPGTDLIAQPGQLLHHVPSSARSHSRAPGSRPLSRVRLDGFFSCRSQRRSRSWSTDSCNRASRSTMSCMMPPVLVVELPLQVAVPTASCESLLQDALDESVRVEYLKVLRGFTQPGEQNWDAEFFVLDATPGLKVPCELGDGGGLA